MISGAGLNKEYLNITIYIMPFKIQPIRHFYTGKHCIIHIITPNIPMMQCIYCCIVNGVITGKQIVMDQLIVVYHGIQYFSCHL